MFDVVFKPDHNCVCVFIASRICATRYVQLAFAVKVEHAQRIPVFDPFSLAWLCYLLSLFILATPVMSFMATLQRVVLFDTTFCKYSFLCYLKVLLHEAITSYFPYLTGSGLDMSCVRA